MKRTTLWVLAGVLVLGVAAGEVWGRTVPAGAVDPVEDTYLHTGPGYSAAQGSSIYIKLGKDFDSGDSMALLKWDLTGFPDPLRRVVADFRRLTRDGSFAVHQMLVDWDETAVKADFGGGLPVAGVHYVAEPVAAFGFNDEETQGYGVDQFDVTKLFRYWQANPASNKGLIAVPRGQLNANYPGTFGNECLLAARERVAGIDGDDLWVVPTGGSPTTPSNVLEAIEDATLYEGSLADYLRSGRSSYTSLDDRTGQRDYSLLKFGFGDLVLDGTDLAGRGFTQADLELHTITSSQTITFNVHKMLTPWDEVTVTWNQFGTGGPVAGTDYATTPIGGGTIGGGTASVTIDILSVANEWAADPSSNHGLVVIPTTADTVTDNLNLVSAERILGDLDGDDTRLIVTVAPVPTPSGTVILVE